MMSEINTTKIVDLRKPLFLEGDIGSNQIRIGKLIVQNGKTGER